MKSRCFLMFLTVGIIMQPASRATGQQQEVIAVYKLLQDGKDFSAVERLRKLAATSPDKRTKEAAASALAQYGPRLDALPLFTPAYTGDKASQEDIAAAKVAERRPAIPAIMEMARSRRIVILNEAHDDPEHRAFALSVLTALRSAGFSRLAIEALTNDSDPKFTDVAGLRKRGYPVRETGGYIGDPVFADMIRKALALGYEPVAYEQTYDQSQKDGDSIDAREEAQANNLAQAMAQNPTVRFVVYVGYHHAAKLPLFDDGKPQRWMAARLWEKTGSEPLTIDQTGLGSTTQEKASVTLRDIVRQRGITQPTILYADGKPLLFGSWRGTVDLQVVHPTTVVTKGRPTWLTDIGRHLQKPDPKLIPASGRALVQAFLLGEGDDAIPVDQIVLGGKSYSWFMLPSKPVRFVVKEVIP